MIDRASQYIAVLLASKDGDEIDKTSIYQVGVDVVISTAVTLAGIICLSIWLDDFFGGLLFLMCFMTVRSYSGGYHAPTRTKCFLLTCGAYIVTMPSIIMIPVVYCKFVSVLFAAVVLVIWVLFVPVENRNKRLSADWKKKNRKKAWISVVAWYIAAGVIYHFNVQLSFQIVMTILVIAILILCSKPWKE